MERAKANWTNKIKGACPCYETWDIGKGGGREGGVAYLVSRVEREALSLRRRGRERVDSSLCLGGGDLLLLALAHGWPDDGGGVTFKPMSSFATRGFLCVCCT